mmetsp:Transcript_55086/g.134839  ORF Transcript_55086/g.134839 Transcript_55086/m.134839 type:complete len:267 (+) Transcript_55086:5587-6387(+)
MQLLDLFAAFDVVGPQNHVFAVGKRELARMIRHAFQLEGFVGGLKYISHHALGLPPLPRVPDPTARVHVYPTFLPKVRIINAFRRRLGRKFPHVELGECEVRLLAPEHHVACLMCSMYPGQVVHNLLRASNNNFTRGHRKRKPVQHQVSQHQQPPNPPVELSERVVREREHLQSREIAETLRALFQIVLVQPKALDGSKIAEFLGQLFDLVVMQPQIRKCRHQPSHFWHVLDLVLVCPEDQNILSIEGLPGVRAHGDRIKIPLGVV